MKKKYAKNQLQEAITKVNNIVDNRVGCFQEPIIPSDCPTFDEATANYVRERLGLYLKSWVLPKLDNSIMEKQEFIEKYNFVKESVISAMDKALERALENEVIDLSKCDGNYLDVYPLIGAVLKRELSYILDGSPTYSRYIKRKATKYNYDYRIWHDYAGDYKHK